MFTCMYAVFTISVPYPPLQGHETRCLLFCFIWSDICFNRDMVSVYLQVYHK